MFPLRILTVSSDCLVSSQNYMHYWQFDKTEQTGHEAAEEEARIPMQDASQMCVAFVIKGSRRGFFFLYS